MSERTDRRRNPALRRRIDQLLGRVRAAQAEIVELGLNAVHDAPTSDERDAASDVRPGEPGAEPRL